VIFWGRIKIASIKVNSIRVNSKVTPCDAIRIQNRENIKNKCISQFGCHLIIFSELIDDTTQDM
jgi:hypothetical protein